MTNRRSRLVLRDSALTSGGKGGTEQRRGQIQRSTSTVNILYAWKYRGCYTWYEDEVNE